MRRLLPGPVDGSPYGDLVIGDPEGPSGRPWVALGMVASVDGATDVEGRTATLGGPLDAVAFRALRDAASVVLVGAATVRREAYGPGAVDAARRRHRRGKGLGDAPRIVVVTATGALDPEAPLFGPRPAGVAPPVLLVAGERPSDVTRATADLVARVEVEVVPLGIGVEPEGGPAAVGEAVFAALTELGLEGVLCEGGPRLAGALLAADRVDELFLTIAPVAFGGPAERMAVGSGPARARPLRLVEVWEDRSELLVRYQRERGGAATPEGRDAR